MGVVVLCRLCTRLYWLYSFPRLLNRLSRGGGYSCTGLREGLRLGLYLCVRMRERL